MGNYGLLGVAGRNIALEFLPKSLLSRIHLFSRYDPPNPDAHP
jgi:hypothetical protein